MACYGPLAAWQPGPGEPLRWSENQSEGGRELAIPCGQCIGCRLDRSLQWATRCMHEATMHRKNAFITLTFDERHLPNDVDGYAGLDHRYFQRFMKRLRRQLTCFDVTLWTHVPRYYMAGEYGSLNDRPHFHACLFGVDFPDRYHWTNLESGFQLFRSPLLEKLWTNKNDEPLGFSTTGSVTFESAAYVARYCTKKVTGPRAAAHYERINPFTGEITALTPEYNCMSLKPPIGEPWFNKYFHSSVGSRDQITLQGGRKVKVPRAYDRMADKANNFDNEYNRLLLREQRARAAAKECTPERLATRERVALARHKLKQRQI